MRREAAQRDRRPQKLHESVPRQAGSGLHARGEARLQPRRRQRDLRFGPVGCQRSARRQPVSVRVTRIELAYTEPQTMDHRPKVDRVTLASQAVLVLQAEPHVLAACPRATRHPGIGRRRRSAGRARQHIVATARPPRLPRTSTRAPSMSEKASYRLEGEPEGVIPGLTPASQASDRCRAPPWRCPSHPSRVPPGRKFSTSVLDETRLRNRRSQPSATTAAKI